VWHAGSVLLGHEPFGSSRGAALGPGFQHADLPVTGWGGVERHCFTLPFGFLADALSCVLDLQWHLPFGSFFLQVYSVVAPQTTLVADRSGAVRGHECAAWCKLTAASP